jgi:hypothetical protein
MAVAQPEAMSARQLTTSTQLLSCREIIFDLSTVRFMGYFRGGFLGRHGKLEVELADAGLDSLRCAFHH